MTEIRTTSSTGGEKGVKPQRMDLLPYKSLFEIAEVYGFGAEKYADHNWRKGYEWSKSYAAMMRHLALFWEGEDNDPESGLPHLAHAGFHVLALLENAREHPEFDDRYRKPVEEPELFKQVAEAITKIASASGVVDYPPGHGLTTH